MIYLGQPQKYCINFTGSPSVYEPQLYLLFSDMSG